MNNKQVKPKIKAPSQSKNVGKRVAKNLVRQLTLEDEQVREILMDFAAPGETGRDPLRLSGDDDCNSSAVASLHKIITPVFAALTNTSDKFDSPLIVFRNALRFAITMQASTFGYSYTSPVITIPTTTANVPFLINPQYFYFSGSLSNNRPHGDCLFCGSIGTNERFFYCGAQDTIQVNNFSSSTPTLIIRKYANGNVTQVGSVTLAASTQTAVAVPASSGYYSLQVLAAGTITTFQVAITIVLAANVTNNPVFGHMSLPFMYSNITSVEAIKINSVSAKLTNDSAPNYKEGKIIAYQLPKGSDWQQYTTYNSLSDLSDSCSLPAENGVFIYLKPVDVNDLVYTAFNQTNSGNLLVDAYFDLIPRDFLVIAPYLPNLSGQDINYTVRANVQYLTEDPWRSKRYPAYSPQLIMQAKYLLARQPQVFENPLHLGDIASWIGNAIKKGINFISDEVLPTVVRVGETAVKLAPLVAGAAALL